MATARIDTTMLGLISIVNIVIESTKNGMLEMSSELLYWRKRMAAWSCCSHASRGALAMLLGKLRSLLPVRGRTGRRKCLYLSNSYCASDEPRKVRMVAEILVSCVIDIASASVAFDCGTTD